MALTPVFKYRRPAPTMSLTSLPPELLDQVLSDKELQKRDLANLARVNRSIYPLVLRRLYADVLLDGSDHREDMEVLDLFNRALTESPRLAAATQSLTIITGSPNDARTIPSKEIIGNLHALRTLPLGFYGMVHCAANFLQMILPAELDTSAAILSKIQDLEITHPAITFSGIIKLISLPRIERLAVKCHPRQEAREVAVLPSTEGTAPP
ncbi:uncharacterized protein N7482_010466 [Penicillium canariense]|uniref:F-box domain-containing protein n=1 Tax=Penicillium canariense TaxID=189055 RepID=A0A9W9HP69_9EURO|nr:uncharacterized protein N7482_010466 [Penicillium canariense]KAJ5151214.1 hypothetical protein N7482_010466 [Penicillium canariense]